MNVEEENGKLLLPVEHHSRDWMQISNLTLVYQAEGEQQNAIAGRDQHAFNTDRFP